MPMPYRPYPLSSMLAGTRPLQTGYPKQRRGFVLAKRPDPRGATRRNSQFCYTHRGSP